MPRYDHPLALAKSLAELSTGTKLETQKLARVAAGDELAVRGREAGDAADG
jgi:hypothetical protein